MALELNTDGDAQTFTAGDAGFKYGNTNTSTVGAVYGFCTFMLGVYAGFVNVVTGVAIHIETPISISIFGGFRFVVQGGACYTVSKISEGNVHADVVKKITNLQEMLSSQTQIIDTSTKTITELTQKVAKKISNYDVEEKNGDTSTEEWTASKSITSPSYDLNCQEIALITVNDASIRVDTGGTYINGKIIDLGN